MAVTLSGEILLIQIHPVSHACAFLAQTEVVRGPLATVRITFQPLQVELLVLPPLLLAQRRLTVRSNENPSYSVDAKTNFGEKRKLSAEGMRQVC